jgi:hypothetical protein
MKAKLEWERVDNNHAGVLYRSRVPWGWLVYDVQEVFHPDRCEMDRSGTGWDWRTSMAFVFDPFHWWR